MREGSQATSAEQGKELDALIGELESNPEVRNQAAALDAAQHRRRQLFRELRERRNARMSQVELAERVGTSQPAVARIEAGLADPKLSTLDRFAAALGYELRHVWQPIPQQGTPGLVHTASAGEVPDAIEKLIEEMSAAPHRSPSRRQSVTVEVEPRVAGDIPCFLTLDPFTRAVTGSGPVGEITECVQPLLNRLAGKHTVSLYCEILDSGGISAGPGEPAFGALPRLDVPSRDEWDRG